MTLWDLYGTSSPCTEKTNCTIGFLGHSASETCLCFQKLKIAKLDLFDLTIHLPRFTQMGLNCIFRPAGGCLNTPCGFSRIARKRRRCAPPDFHLPYPHLFGNFCQVFDPGSCKVRSPGQVKWPHLTKNLQSRPSYSVWGKVMKLSEYDKVIGTYKMYISDFWYRWP